MPVLVVGLRRETGNYGTVVAFARVGSWSIVVGDGHGKPVCPNFMAKRERLNDHRLTTIDSSRYTTGAPYDDALSKSRRPGSANGGFEVDLYSRRSAQKTALASGFRNSLSSTH